MIKILVTGAGGQLGQCIANAATKMPDAQFVFATRDTLDISDNESLTAFIEEHQFNYCINTAAYTQVDQAEKEPEQAYLINTEAVKNLAKACDQNNLVLIHISTDYVFDGSATTPYPETHPTNPIGVYGTSKLKGEEYVQSLSSKHFIIRTSWLYSQYATNFYTSVSKWIQEERALTITTEQTGAPTNANDLARVLLKIITSKSTAYGTYHFSNTGQTTWYGFAKAIIENTKAKHQASIASTDHYPTFAKRPAYSVLDTKKIQQTFDIKITSWEESLKNLTQNNQL